MTDSLPSKIPRAWQRMLSGRRLDLLDPSPFDIEIEDIAHGLARMARWNGQTRGPYIFSVAQHSLLTERLAAGLNAALSPQEALLALLHDAPEYVIGDLISPFKAVIGDSYKSVENRLMSAILMRFGLSAALPAAFATLIKKADRASAYYEAIHLAGFSLEEAARIFDPPEVRPNSLEALMRPMTANEAEAAFLTRFYALEKTLARDK